MLNKVFVNQFFRYQKLNKAMSEVISDYSLVSFIPISVEKPQSLFAALKVCYLNCIKAVYAICHNLRTWETDSAISPGFLGYLGQFIISLLRDSK